MKFSFAVAGLIIGLMVSQNAVASDVDDLPGLLVKKQVVTREEAETLKSGLVEKKLKETKTETAEKPKDVPIVSAGKEGFSIKSANDDFQLKIRGYAKWDGRFYVGDHEKPGTSTFLLRSAVPIIEGKLAKYYTFKIQTDFGGGATALQDTYLDIDYWSGTARLRAGKFKPPFGLERLQSSTENLFAELSLPSNLTPNYDVGAQIHGEVFDGRIGYAAGIFNGVADGSTGDTDNNDGKDFVGRIFALPFKTSETKALSGLGIGLGYSFGDHKGTTAVSNLPSYKTHGQQTFFSYSANVFSNGEQTRISPQAYYYYGPFGLLTEYVASSQTVQKGTAEKTLENKGWQVAASYVLMGGKASYKGVKPDNSFEPGGSGFGTFEVAARYGVLEVDRDAFPTFSGLTTSAKKASELGVGLNWYLSANVKFILDYERTDFEGGASGGEDREAENTVETRLQVSF